MENPHISEAMNLCFKNVMEKNAEELLNIIGILLRLLACMVHHSKFIIDNISTNNTANKLNQIPIYTDKKILNELRKLVKTKPSSKIPKPSGIPPHTHILVSLSLI